MKNQFLLGVALGALVAAPSAMTAAPAYRPAPVYNWTGCYAGGNVGYGWGSSGGDINIPALSSTSLSTPLPTQYSISLDPAGVIGGVQIGCNRQLDNRWVIGLEADFQGSGLKASRNLSSFNTGGEGFSASAEAKLHWFGTVRARGGVLVAPTVLLFATGGLAYGNASLSSIITATALPGQQGGTATTSIFSSATNIGWIVGAGIEGAFPNSTNWTWKFEYLYMDLGSISANGIDPILGSYNWNANIRDNILRVGLNYRFNNFGSAPVGSGY